MKTPGGAKQHLDGAGKVHLVGGDDVALDMRVLPQVLGLVCGLKEGLAADGAPHQLYLRAESMHA